MDFRDYVFPIPKNITNEIKGFMSQNIALYDFHEFEDALETWLTKFQRNPKSSLTLFAFFRRPEKIYRFWTFLLIWSL